MDKRMLPIPDLDLFFTSISEIQDCLETLQGEGVGVGPCPTHINSIR